MWNASRGIFWVTILGEGVVSTVGRNEEMIRAYIRNQEMAGVGSAAIEARVLMKSHLSSQNPL
jgi:hypothetical protein